MVGKESSTSDTALSESHGERGKEGETEMQVEGRMSL